MKYTDVPILMYHEIGEHDSPWCVSPKAFEQQMLILKRHGFRTISLHELRKGIEQNEETPEKLAVITFDDGRKGVYTHALPLFQKLGFTGTIYIVPQWIDRKESIPNSEKYSDFLTWEELKELVRSGFEIGSHTFSHKNLAGLDPPAVLQELAEADRIISERFHLPVHHFSYPYGQFTTLVQEKVWERYATAVTVKKGFAKLPGAYARQWIQRDTSFEQFQKLLFPPTLSLCMIVRNEEEFLEQCLASVKGLVDEMVIVDTGSSDATKKIASAFTDTIYDFAWCDDFAAARNESLRHATGDWVLVLDADEVLAPEDHAVIRESINSWEISGFQLLTKNYCNDSSIMGWRPCPPAADPSRKQVQGWFPSLKVRLFQRRAGLKFTGAVHEMVDSSITSLGGRIASCPVLVHHYGTLQLQASHKTGKYLELNKKKTAENPLDAKAFFELGIQYKELGRFALAEEALERSLALDSQLLPLLNLAIIQQKQDKFDQAIQTFFKVLEKKEKTAEAHFGLGFCFFRKHQLEESANHFQSAIGIDPLHLDAYINLGAVYEKQGKYPAAITILKMALRISPDNGRCHYNLGVAYEKTGNLSLALHAYQKALDSGYVRKDELQERITKIKQFMGT